VTDDGAARTAGRPRVTAIVLAGGRAERFGSDKLEVALDGMTLLDRAIEAVSQVADNVLVAGPAEGRTRPGIDVIADREPFGGPLAGLAGALQQTSSELAVVVGGDMPRLVPAVLTEMLHRLAGDPTLDAVILAVDGAPRRQVLPLAVRVGPALAAAHARLESDDRSLAALLDSLTAIELAPSDWRPFDPVGQTLADVDTPAELDRLRSGGHGASAP
jgi:molybdenum cofactor guanylyltransferase